MKALSIRERVWVRGNAAVWEASLD